MNIYAYAYIDRHMPHTWVLLDLAGCGADGAQRLLRLAKCRLYGYGHKIFV